MISAEEAKKVATSVDNVSILAAVENLDNAITNAANKNDTSINASSIVLDLTDNQFEVVKKELTRLGYKVKDDSGYDQMDGDSWRTVTVSW